MIRNATIDTLLRHRSTRAFTDAPLPAGAEETLREAMRRGPTSSALQTYTIVFVHDPAVRARIRPHAGNQEYVERCALLIVACADLRRVAVAAEARGYTYRASDLRILVSSVEDLTIGMQNASVAAQSLGLGTVMIGGVANGMREIHALLALPRRVAPLLGLCVGVPAESQRDVQPRPRLPADVVFHRDRFRLEQEREAELLAAHDREVVERGYYQGRRIGWSDVGGDEEDPVPEDGYGWSEHVARKQSRTWWLRFGPKFADDLRALGIDVGARAAPGEPEPRRPESDPSNHEPDRASPSEDATRPEQDERSTP